LELLVQSGFTPLQALQSATFTPALFMAKLDHYGVVELGRDADLVLLDANPLENITNLNRISAVVMAGQYLSRDDLDHMLSHAAELAKGTQ
jgi:imidazolonepropionase-like amidohydrolase